MNRAEKRRQEKLAKKAARSTKSGKAPLVIQESLALATQHHTAGRLSEAETLYQQILRANPNQPDAIHLLGVLAYQGGQYDSAVELISKALAIKPDYPEASYNLGNTLKKLHRPDVAIASYHKALAINPDYFEAHNNLGLALKDLNKLDEAVASYHKALAIKPNFAEAHNNLGFALNALNKLDEAVESYRQALAINPNLAEAHYNLGNNLLASGKLIDAAASFRKALTNRPEYHEAHSNLIFLQDFIPDIDQKAQQNERRLWNSTFILPLADKIQAHSNNRDPARPLRIGYVSADFRDHSACLGFAPLIMEHKRQDFEVICYDATISGDHVSASLRTAATHWRDIRDSDDDQLAAMIRVDAIDILVDLSGHTRGNRLGVFARKPAPLQVTGIGHLAPGASTIDYRLTTPQMTPPNEETIYPEKPLYLETYFGFTPAPDAPPVGPPPCLKNGFITFGFLGRFIKISDDVLALWARILQDTAGARLLLKFSQLDDPAARQKIVETFSGLGIGVDRLVLMGRTEQGEHLEAHNLVDIVLDSFPHGGGITTMDSLWMGVPVIGLLDTTKAGGRIIDGICHPVGLEDWVAGSREEYRAIALKQAGQAGELGQIRQELRRRVADVYGRFPGAVEKAYRLIWQRWCQGETPSALYPLS
ncbi:MAG: tetratricopeptide repeat protein [Rhodospirillales bacterium]|nr:tetratricopeptide repeat protein [Rhodospirillales bacterium]